MRNRIIAGLLAGAAGTTALNAVTYSDMALRGRGRHRHHLRPADPPAPPGPSWTASSRAGDGLADA
jgi:hypothetical protein